MPLVSGAQTPQNAALVRRGARIEVSSPNGVNDRWNAPSDMLDDERLGGPILNDLQSATIVVTFPIPFQIMRIGLEQADDKGTFARVKGITVEAPGADYRDFTLADRPEQVQFFDYRARTDRITIRVRSLYPPRVGANPYGALARVQVLVADNLDARFTRPTDFRPGPVFVMTTSNLDPRTAPPVLGKPRKATEHPLTIWDKEDIAAIKEQIARLPQARVAYQQLLAGCDALCAHPLAVPDQPDDDTNEAIVQQHTAVSSGIANLGIGYVLSGDEKYAREARRLLLELAKRYEAWPVHGSPHFSFDASKWSWQRLGDAIWLIPTAWGFDLIHSSPSLSDADRRTICNHFLMPCVKNIMSSPSYLQNATNWSVIGAAAVMIGARAAGDQEFYEKSYLGLSREPGKKDGGLFYQLDNGIDDDGMWAEGSLGYQFMAIRGLLVMAEILWHDGIDVYGYRNDRLKKVFDSPIWYAYPGANGSPAIHDGGGGGLFGRDTHLYQYARRRYGDTAYDALLAETRPSLESVYNLFLPAFDFTPVNRADLPRVPSVLFPGVGFAIARTGDGQDGKYLVMDYGPNRSHGHPDKLNFCLYALGQELFADAGSAWYSTDIYKRYDSQTLAHNTISANGMNQLPTAGRLEDFGSQGDMALIRTRCDTAIPSAVLDRTLFLSGGRLYDIYRAASGIPFTFELPYHSHGTLEQKVATAPWKDCPKDRPGYAYFSDPVIAPVSGDWQCAWKLPGGKMTLHYVGEPGSQIVFARTPMGGDELPTALIRRTTSDTVFAGVCDLVPTGGSASIRSVRRIAIPKNRGYALHVDLAAGGYELLLVNYSGQPIAADGWSTDGRVAFIRVVKGRMDALYLAGGTRLKGPAVQVASSVPTLLTYQTIRDGLGQFANQGEKATDARLTGIGPFDALSRMDRTGRRLSVMRWDKGGTQAKIHAPARQTFELTRGAQPTVAELTAQNRRAKRREEAEQKRRTQETQALQIADQTARAKASAIPTDYFVLIQAEDTAAEGGGRVTISADKVGAYGKAIKGWNDKGQWLAYDFEVRHDGWYKVVLKYCREGGPTVRALQIDGAFPSEAARRMAMPGTGGWSNGTDNWQYYTLQWPGGDQPCFVYMKAGRHRLRLENPVGDDGANLDLIVIAAPFLQITRDLVEHP